MSLSFVLSISFSLTSENIFEEPVWEKEGRWLPWLKWIAGSYYLPVAGRGCNALTKKNILGCILLPGMHPSYHLGGYGHVAALVCSFIYVVIYHSVIMIILMICLVPIKAIVWSLRDYGADSDNRTFRDQMHYDGDSLKSILLKGQISTSVDGIKGLTAFFFESALEKKSSTINLSYRSAKRCTLEGLGPSMQLSLNWPEMYSAADSCILGIDYLHKSLALKNYKSISEKQKELESRVQNCQEKLESCEELLRKTQSETRKSLQQISTEIQQSKPLTKREVLNLVQEIAEQPKLVEKEALRLTEDLNQKIQKVEHLLHEVKKLITG
ncbi:putative polyprotein [Tanacetum coccineum]